MLEIYYKALNQCVIELDEGWYWCFFDQEEHGPYDSQTDAREEARNYVLDY